MRRRSPGFLLGCVALLLTHVSIWAGDCQLPAELRASPQADVKEDYVLINLPSLPESPPPPHTHTHLPPQPSANRAGLASLPPRWLYFASSSHTLPQGGPWQTTAEERSSVMSQDLDSFNSWKRKAVYPFATRLRLVGKTTPFQCQLVKKGGFPRCPFCKGKMQDPQTISCTPTPQARFKAHLIFLGSQFPQCQCGLLPNTCRRDLEVERRGDVGGSPCICCLTQGGFRAVGGALKAPRIPRERYFLHSGFSKQTAARRGNFPSGTKDILQRVINIKGPLPQAINS